MKLLGNPRVTTFGAFGRCASNRPQPNRYQGYQKVLVDGGFESNDFHSLHAVDLRGTVDARGRLHPRRRPASRLSRRPSHPHRDRRRLAAPRRSDAPVAHRPSLPRRGRAVPYRRVQHRLGHDRRRRVEHDGGGGGRVGRRRVGVLVGRVR